MVQYAKIIFYEMKYYIQLIIFNMQVKRIRFGQVRLDIIYQNYILPQATVWSLPQFFLFYFLAKSRLTTKLQNYYFIRS